VFLAGKFLFVRSNTFAVAYRIYRLATKRTGIKTSRRKREREFFKTKTTACAPVYSALLTVENLIRSTSRTFNFARHSWVDWVWVWCSLNLTAWIGLRGYILDHGFLPYDVRSTIDYYSNNWASCYVRNSTHLTHSVGLAEKDVHYKHAV